jgi:hypothetical protein
MIIPLSKKETLKQLRAVIKTITTNKEIYLLNEIVEKEKIDSKTLLYSARQWMQDYKTKERTKKDIAILLNKINDILEGRVLKLGLENKINNTLAQFTLKNLYNWKDKQEIENKTINVELNSIFDEIINTHQDITQTKIQEPKALKEPENIFKIEPRRRGLGKKKKAKAPVFKGVNVRRVAPYTQVGKVFDTK